MAAYLKSTAYTRTFKMIDSTDHISKKTGLTCTVNISKAGAAFGTAAGTVTEVASGWYKVALTTVDTNTAGDLSFYITASGADDTDFVDQVLDPTVANYGVNVVNWNNTVVATPATAGIPDVNAKNWNNLATVALPLIPTVAGRTLDVSAGGEAGLDWANVGSPTTSLALTGTTIATTQKVDVDTIKTNPVVNGGTVTFPSNATLASTTNITAGTIATVTTLTNLPAITANWLTAAGIAANALNGKGDWLLASNYVAPSNLTAAQIATGIWQDATAGDFTAALSIGKSIMNGVALGTGLTINGYTGNTVQTGDSYALANGVNGFVATKADTAAIKAKTDSLNFTVPGYANVNVLYQNGAQVYGIGTAGNLWRGTP